ncbi:hypothetical protein J2T48_001502 [Pseudomonas nitroreducens]|nr:hypothetical protein [Pseudomonas nitroreducens]
MARALNPSTANLSAIRTPSPETRRTGSRPNPHGDVSLVGASLLANLHGTLPSGSRASSLLHRDLARHDTERWRVRFSRESVHHQDSSPETRRAGSRPNPRNDASLVGASLLANLNGTAPSGSRASSLLHRDLARHDAERWRIRFNRESVRQQDSLPENPAGRLATQSPQRCFPCRSELAREPARHAAKRFASKLAPTQRPGAA